MKRRILGGLLLLAAPAVPSMAQQDAASAQASDAQQLAVAAAGEATPEAEAANAGKKKEKVCKPTDVTGSRFKRKLCYTQQEWDAIDRAHRDKMREIDSQPIRQRSEGS